MELEVVVAAIMAGSTKPNLSVVHVILWSVNLVIGALEAFAETTATTCHKNSLIVPVEAYQSGLYRRSRALIIAHRGASYHLPEHSLESYRLALELGADFIEPDLVVSSDGVLLAMHSVDLNDTTNVVDLFASTHQPWFSPTANRTGYWTFNFTWAQIQTLRLKQRLPSARTTLYDGLLRVPSLDDILQLLHEWNTVDLPATLRFTNATSTTSAEADATISTASTLRPLPLQKYQSGLYIEFKSRSWILKESGLDIVALLYEHIVAAFDDSTATAATAGTTAAAAWKQLLPCFASTRFDEYIVPGLVLQSFEATDLQQFHEKWHGTTSVDGNSIATPHVPMVNRAAEPPYVLLVDKPQCWEDSFWFAVGEKWRSFLSGIGCDKNCLLWQSASLANGTTTSSSAMEKEKRRSIAISDKAMEFGLVLHPWTERPESSFFASTESSSYPVESSMDEMHHLLCKVPGVHGIFSESVDRAVQAAFLACDKDSDHTKANVPNSNNGPMNSSANSPFSTGLCYENQSEANLYVGFASFVVGTFVALVLSCGWQHCKSLRRRRQQSYQAPPTNDEPNDDLELTLS